MFDWQIVVIEHMFDRRVNPGTKVSGSSRGRRAVLVPCSWVVVHRVPFVLVSWVV